MLNIPESEETYMRVLAYPEQHLAQLNANDTVIAGLKIER